MVLNIGDSAPDFELTDPDMKMRTLGEFKGKKIVLSFIVAASSPVCETELCTFRDSWDEISNLGAQVIAISNDGPFANKSFAEKHNFNFPLLGDYNSKTIRDYVNNQLLARDSRALREYVREVQPDVNLTFDYEDEYTGEIKRGVNVPLNLTFLWPDFTL